MRSRIIAAAAVAITGGALGRATWLTSPSQCEESGVEKEREREKLSSTQRPSRLHWFGLQPSPHQNDASSQPCPSSIAVGGGVFAAIFPDGSISATASSSTTSSTTSTTSPDLQLPASRDVSALAVDGAGSILFGTMGGRIEILRRQSQGGVAAGWSEETECVGHLDSSVRDIQCGAGHCIAVDVRGRAWSWATRDGEGKTKGALGRVIDDSEKTSAMVAAPVEMPVDAGKIAASSCGDAHTMLLGEDGRLWAFGSDRWLQLGIAETWENGASNRMLPVQVAGVCGKHVSMVACGGDHTVAAMRDGEVLAWGRGKEGQLGAKKVFASAGITRVSGTTAMPPLRPVAVAAAGHCTLVAVSDSGGGSKGGDAGTSLWWMGRCLTPVEGQEPAGVVCFGGDEGNNLLLGMGSASPSGNPRGGDSTKTAAAVGLIPEGAHLGGGCASCRAKNMLKEMKAASAAHRTGS